MADQKLSPSLFSAKTRASESAPSTPYLHFIAAVRQDRDQNAFVCEGQPLLTVTTFGRPKRCPLCGQDDPIGNQINHERRKK
jgi:hypothetical protein